MATPLATWQDVEAAWRPLTGDELPKVEALIARASRMIRARWADVDDRIAAGTLDAADVADVVAEMVQSAMVVPMPGAEQFAETAGPFSQSVRFANPLGRVFITAEMARLFDGPRFRRAFSVDLTPGA